MNKAIRTIALLPLTRTNWPIMVRLARELKILENDPVRPIIILSNRLVKTLAADLGDEIQCIEVQDFPGPSLATPGEARVAWTGGLVDGLRTMARGRWLEPLLCGYKTFQISRQLKMAKRLLKELRPRAIVVPGDRNTGLEPLVLRAGRELGIVSIIPPIAISATLEGLFIARRQNAGYFVTHRPDFKRRFPNQWRHDPLSGEDLSFYGKTTTRAYDKRSVLSDNPWVIGGGFSDWVMAESEDAKRRYVDLGVAAEKIVVTGHPDHDELAASLRDKKATRLQLINKYGLDPSQKILVLCLPNWAEVGFKTWEWHWAENEFLCRCATRVNCNVLLSLHPSQSREQYVFLEKCYPSLRILDERLATVLPATDIYVTGLSSSTVPWAVLAGVPTVLADHYSEKDRIHFGLPGVTYVPESKDLEATVERLVGDENYFEELRRRQYASGHLYGKPDGRAMKRIIQTLLTAQPRSHLERPVHAA
jgi:UDP-N-acetylglucosamine 2-epimerase